MPFWLMPLLTYLRSKTLNEGLKGQRPRPPFLNILKVWACMPVGSPCPGTYPHLVLPVPQATMNGGHTFEWASLIMLCHEVGVAQDIFSTGSEDCP